MRVVLVREQHGWLALFSTDVSLTAAEILSAAADRFRIEQDFHDLKAVEGLGQQQVRDIWANVGAFHLNGWVHVLIALGAWQQPQEAICDRSDVAVGQRGPAAIACGSAQGVAASVPGRGISAAWVRARR